MNVFGVILGLLGLLLLTVAFLGWAVFLGVGLWARRKLWGKIFLATGGLWFAGSACLAIIAVSVWRSAGDEYEEKAFVPETHAGPMGSIEVAAPCRVSLTVRDAATRKMLRLQSTNETGVLRAPVGTYTPWSIELTLADTNGTPWTAQAFPGGGGDRFTVVEGKTNSLSLGPPFVVSVKRAASHAGMLRCELAVTDGTGASYTITAKGGGRRKPGFRAFDAGGAEVMKGVFEYG